jgi:hypothetical protein
MYSDLFDMAVSDWMFDQSAAAAAIPVYYSIVVLVASINLGEHSERKHSQMIKARLRNRLD